MEQASTQPNKYTFLLKLLPLFLICIAGIVYLQLPRVQKQPLENFDLKAYREQEQRKIITLNLLGKIPTFGFDNLIADWAFLDFVQYYGDTPTRLLTDYVLCPEYFQLLVQRDPRFIEAIFILDPATSLFAGRPDKTVAYMTQALKYIDPKQPSSYLVWMNKAINQVLFLGDNQGAQHSYEMASKWASLFSNELSQYVATSSAESAKFLANNPDSTEVRASAWAMILTNARDEKTINLAKEKIEALGGKITVTPNGVTVKMPEVKK